MFVSLSLIMELNKEEKLEQLERVLSSRVFQGSESLRSFLRFVVEKTLDDQDAQLKEYVIATEVFGRNDDYDPRIDSVVRVQAGRLRSKLQEYYATEGKTDKVVIDLPKGHYRPIFSKTLSESLGSHQTIGLSASGSANNGAVVSNMVHVQAIPSSKKLRDYLPHILSVIILILLIAVIALIQSNRELRNQGQSAIKESNLQDVEAVWGTFLKDPNPPLLVLSNPPVYRFVNESDPNVLTQNAIRLSPNQVPSLPEFNAPFITQDGKPPRLIPTIGMFTGIGEAISLHHLTDFFRSANKSIEFKHSRHVSATDVKYRNVILLGSIYVNEWSGKLPAGENFVITDRASIENQNPQQGEERIYKPQHDEKTGKLLVDYAIITVKQNVSDENTVVILAGVYSEGTEAAGEFVTNKKYLALLNQRLQQMNEKEGKPKFYQALLKVGVENGVPTTISLLALRKLDGQAQ